MKPANSPFADKHRGKWLITSLAVVVLAVMSLLGYLIWSGYREAKNEAETKTRNYAAIIEARLDATLRRVDASLWDLARTIPVAALSQQAVSRYARELDAKMESHLFNFPELAALRIFDANGDRLYTTGSDTTPRTHISDRNYYRLLRGNPHAGLVFSEVVISRSRDRPSVVATRALRDERGAFRGIVLAAIELDYFQKLFESLGLGAHGIASIYRSDDFTAVVRWPVVEGKINIPLPPDNPLRAALAPGIKTATIELASSTDGFVRIYSSQVLDRYPFFATAGLAREDVLAGWSARALAVGLSGLLLLGLLSGLLYWLWRAEAALKVNEELMRTTFEQAAVGIAHIAPDTYRILMANDKFYNLLGYAPSELIGTDSRLLTPADDMVAREAERAQVMAGKIKTSSSERRLIKKDGAPLWINRSLSLVRDVAGRPQYFISVMEDITERKRAEQLLALEHTVARALANAGSGSAAVIEVIRSICETQGWECGRYLRVDEQAGVLRFSECWNIPDDAIEQFVASKREAVFGPGVGLAGRAWQSGQPAWIADIKNDVRSLKAAVTLETGMQCAFHFPVISEGKTIGVLAFNSRKVREPDDRLLQAVRVIGGQIGQYLQRKQAEEDLRRFRAAVDASSDLTLLVNRASMRYIDVNDAACRALGYTREELLMMSPQDIFSKTKDELVQLYDRMFAGDSVAPTVEGVYRCKDGSQLLIEAHPRAVRSTGNDFIVSVDRDIRERRRAEALLRLEHAVTRSLSEADSLEAALKAAIRAICETENWECGRYLYVDEPAGVLRLGQAWGIETEAIRRFLESSRAVTYAPGAGLAGRVWQSGEPLWLPDVGKDSRAAQVSLIRQLGLRGAVFFPIMAKGEMIGMLLFNSREVREPEERLLQAMRVIGSQIGQVVQRKQAEAALRQSEARFRSLTELSSDLYWEQDDQYRFTSIAGAGSERVNVRGFQMVGKKRWEQQYINMSANDWSAHMAILDAHQPFHDLELCRLGESGEKVWIGVSGEPVFDASGVFKGYRGVGKDITGRKQDQDRIQYLATHDGLTGLPNRVMFSQQLNLAVPRARRHNHNIAVLFIDLDRFKIINDILGHEAGDILLREIATRLTECLREGDVVGRLGGDEFVVLLQEVGEAEQAAAVARKILSAASKKFVLLGQECRVTASIGICMYPEHAQDEQSLMKNADIAMYLAKEEGKNNFQFYAERIKAQSLERMTLETSLRHALERNELFLHYQAKLDLKTKEITGVEALLRWRHPDLGMVAPMRFILIAEETGLILPIGRWVLKTACAQNVAWQRDGLPPVCVAINLTARQFADENLLHDIAAALEDSGMRPELLELELTESMVMHNPEQAIKVLTAVKQMGVRIAIDNFGVGYSSLAQIKRFPIDTLKVDRSFVRDLVENAENQAITGAIIAMGRTLSLTVVAEGVETREQQVFLSNHACDAIQGFYFSKPVSQDEFARFMRQRLARTGVE